MNKTVFFCSLLYLNGEFLCLSVVHLHVCCIYICLQLAELLAQQAQRQNCVQTLMMEVLKGLQSSCHVLNLSLNLRKTLAGDLQLQETKQQISVMKLKVCG